MNAYNHQNQNTWSAGQARKSVTTFKTFYKFTPHDARTSAIHATTSKQHLQNGLGANWKREKMPPKKGKPLNLSVVVRYNYTVSNKKAF